jgi:hypothetical protein
MLLGGVTDFRTLGRQKQQGCKDCQILKSMSQANFGIQYPKGKIQRIIY